VRTDFAPGMWRARRNRILAGVACAAALVGAGCCKPVEAQAAVAIEYRISPQPVRVGPVVLSVKLRDASGKPVAGARVDLEVDMSHAGMAPVFGEAQEVAPGQYAGSLDIAMPGDWVVLIHVTLPDGRTQEREVSVPGVTAN
jgi:YtkA-like